MSDPKTKEEFTQAAKTVALAETGELLVSTGCPACSTRFALLVHEEFRAKKLGTWSLSGSNLKTTGNMVHILRCVVCGWSGDGSAKHEFDWCRTCRTALVPDDSGKWKHVDEPGDHHEPHLG